MTISNGRHDSNDFVGGGEESSAVERFPLELLPHFHHKKEIDFCVARVPTYLPNLHTTKTY